MSHTFSYLLVHMLFRSSPVPRYLALVSLLPLLACPALAAAQPAPAKGVAAMPTHYPYLLDPEIYPDYTRRPVPVPTWDTFDRQTQFITLRAFPQEGNRLVRIGEELDRYTKEWGLGRVIWPIIHQLHCENAREMVAEVKARDLYLFDFWGHVPGSGMEGFWSHIVPPPGMVPYLESELGDHFLGIDNGEQDGRYVGGYAPQQCPSYQGRYRQYLNFQRHFERMGNDLGNHLSALVSLCFGHYFLKEGNHVLLGAETAQALPNSQVYYAFIRGAGKQYGVPWFGNASVWNRWSFKSYDGEGKSDGTPYGPDWGTSTGLLKRLMYTHLCYNCVAVGFESGWTQAGGLSPIGKIQQAAARFVRERGSPGVMHSPVALMLDFYSGWAMPRHLYTGKVFQVWGGAPYEEGDYLADGLLSLLYPGYEDAGFYHDERGFLSPTPYGDMADCLLSDAPLWVLRQYGLVILADRVTITAELAQKLRVYVREGGQVLVTSGNAAWLVPGLRVDDRVRVPANSTVRWVDGPKVREPHAFPISLLDLPPGSQVLARSSFRPLVANVPYGEGRFTVLASPFGLNAEPLATGQIENQPDRPLPRPYLLLEHVKRIVASALEAQQLFRVSEGLGFITCRKGRGEYTLAVFNPGLEARPLHLTSCCGQPLSVTELPLDRSEQGQPGYWPTGMGKHDGGRSDARTIAGGDIRLFAVRLAEEQVRLLPQGRPPGRPRGRLLTLRPAGTIQEAILARPTFFQHFDGVKVDWSYLAQRDPAELERERGWLSRQQVRVVVDFSPGLNFYPDLTLLDSLEFRYRESTQAMDDVLAKMGRLGAAEAVFCLHRIPENQCDAKRADELFLSGVADLCRRAAAQGITLYLQPHPEKWYGGKVAGIAAFADKVGAPNLKLALNTCHSAMSGEELPEALAAAGSRLGLVLLSTPGRDQLAQAYDAHRPLWGSKPKLAALSACRGVPMVLDADYPDQDAEYRDAKTVWPKEAP